MDNEHRDEKLLQLMESLKDAIKHGEGRSNQGTLEKIVGSDVLTTLAKAVAVVLLPLFGFLAHNVLETASTLVSLQRTVEFVQKDVDKLRVELLNLQRDTDTKNEAGYRADNALRDLKLRDQLLDDHARRLEKLESRRR